MPSNGRWDLIRHLKIKQICPIYQMYNFAANKGTKLHTLVTLSVITRQVSSRSHVHVDTMCFCNQSDRAASIRLPT